MFLSSEKTAGWVAEYCPICRDVQAMKLIRVGSIQTRAQGVDLTVVECSECAHRVQIDPATYLAVERERPGSISDLMQRTHPRLPLRIVDRVEWDRRAIAGELPPPERAEMIREPFLTLAYLAPHRTQIHISPIVAPIFLVVYGACLAIAGLAGWLTSTATAQPATWPYFFSAWPAIFASIFAARHFNWRSDRRAYLRTIQPKLARALRPLRPQLEDLADVHAWLTATGSPLARFVNVDELQGAVRTIPDRSLTNADSMNISAMALAMWQELNARGEDEPEHTAA